MAKIELVSKKDSPTGQSGRMVNGEFQPNEPRPAEKRQPQNTQAALSSVNADPVPSPIPASMVSPAADVTLPEPQAPAAQEAFVMSLTDNLENSRAALDSQIETRRQEIAAEKERLTSERDKVMQENVAPNLDPFREDLERTQRAELYVNENFEANQRLTNELDTLLTEGNNLIRQMQGLPAANRVVNSRVMNAMNDVNARAGVIQAVINARNSQINQAYTMIDRTVEAITADRNDQLTYYQAILNTKEQGLLDLSKEDEKLANEQLTLAKRDVERAEATADYVKELMIDPNTATIMAEAGVSLLDDVETINSKIGTAVRNKEIAAFTNELTAAGYLVSPIPVEGAEEYEINGTKLYAKVRPGSMLDLEMEQARLAQEATRASIANTYDAIADRKARFDLELQKFDAANELAIQEAMASAATKAEEQEVVDTAKAEKALSMYAAVSELANHPGLSRAVGPNFVARGINPGAGLLDAAFIGNRSEFISEIDRLANSLTLENMDLLKGPATDKDVEIVAASMSRLKNRDVSETSYLEELQRLQNAAARVVKNVGVTDEQLRYYGLADDEAISEASVIWALPGESLDDDIVWP